ncbi:MAG: hypothetical protein GY853_16165 [PVC group bacterium]|nr:hypothetical protein [PVC group bacterium]
MSPTNESTDNNLYIDTNVECDGIKIYNMLRYFIKKQMLCNYTAEKIVDTQQEQIDKIVVIMERWNQRLDYLEKKMIELSK